MEWTRKHQNLTSASNNAVFRSSPNTEEQYLPVRKKSNASEGCNSERIPLHREARKRRKQSRRRLKKQSKKHRSDSKLNRSEVPADVRIKQPNKQLAGCWIKTKVMHWQKYLHNQQLRIQRRCKQGRARLKRETPVHKLLTVDFMRTFPLLLEESNNKGSKAKPFPVSLSWTVVLKYILFETFLVASSVKFRGCFNFVLCFSLAQWFALLNHNIFTSPSRSSNYL